MKHGLSLMTRLVVALGCLCLCKSATIPGQENAANRKSVTVSNPARPALVKASLSLGSIAVKGYDGKEIVVETRLPGTDNGSTKSGAVWNGLSVKEEDNVVTIQCPPVPQPSDLLIRVPANSNLKLNTVNGKIRVDRVNGELEVESVNGEIDLLEVTGSTVAHVVNGRIKAEFTAVPLDKAMTFSSVNGDIDIGFPSRLKARMRMESTRGAVSCDFELQKSPAPGPNNGTGGSRREVRRPGAVGKTVTGLIGGGGSDIVAKTVNGSIRIRKRD